MNNELAVRKALVAGINFDGAMGEGYIFEGNTVRVGYNEVDITDALTSKGIMYAMESMEKAVRTAAKEAGMMAEDCQIKVMTERLARWICVSYSMGEQNEAATKREVAAEGARGSEWGKAEVVE